MKKTILKSALTALVLALAVNTYAQENYDRNVIIRNDPNNGAIHPNDDLQGNIASAQASSGFSGSTTTSVLTDNLSNSGLYIYPNPVTTSNARIVLPEASMSKVAVDVLDMNGRVLRSFEYPAGSYNLDLDMSRMQVGLYTVRVNETGFWTETLKVVKN